MHNPNIEHHQPASTEPTAALLAGVAPFQGRATGLALSV